MAFTDAGDATARPKTGDAPDPSHRLATESYAAAKLGPSPADAPTKDSAVSADGHVTFGSFDDLYGGQTNSVSQSLKTQPSGFDSRWPATESSDLKTSPGTESSAMQKNPAAQAPNPNPDELKEKVDQQLRTQSNNPADIGLSSISPTGVDQNSVGDCYFESAVASMANSSEGQAALRNMIKTNSDGSYTVTFPGDTSNPVTVTQQDLATNQQNKQVEDTSQWGRIVETAFLKYDHAEQYGTGLDAWQDQGTPNLGSVETASDAFHLLTGQTMTTDSLGLVNADNHELTLGATSTANVARSLETALANGEPVTASTQTGVGANDVGPLEGEHVYSVLSYDPKTDTVVVRNPWGNNNNNKTLANGGTVDGITGLGDGKSSMSLATFAKTFNDVNFAGQNPYLNDAQNVAYDQAAATVDLGKTGIDVLSGNFGRVGGDWQNYANATAQVASDTTFGAIDYTERSVGTILSPLWNGALGIANAAVEDFSGVNS